MKIQRLWLVGALLLTLICFYYTTVFIASSRKRTPVLGTRGATAGSRSDKCWVFTHLQKSGGTTVKGILQGSWKHRFAIYDNPHWKRGGTFLQSFGRQLATGKRWNVIAGGYAEALRRSRAAAEKCQWFTLFRHPVPRMVSAYYYCQRSTKDQVCVGGCERNRRRLANVC